MVVALTLALALSAPPVPETLARRIVAETALKQAEGAEVAWPESQRDCAGLVRYAFRAAFLRLAPERVAEGLWRDAAGRPVPFADAGTLLRGSFALLGRGPEARRALRSGDLLAFGRPGEHGEAIAHLMVVVRPGDPAHGPALVVYHPGERGAPVRLGRLGDLEREAPGAWRPLPENPFFLGFFRLKEWMP